MNPHQKGMIEKLLTKLPEELHEQMKSESEYMLKVMSECGSQDELIDKLIYELAVARAHLHKQHNFIRSMGVVYDATGLKEGVDLPKKFATARDFINDITLDMLWFEDTHNVGVLCAASQQYFVMNWESIARIAVRHGVAQVRGEV